MADPWTRLRTQASITREHLDEIKAGVLQMAASVPDACGATAVFWPDDEACEAECIWPAGHGGTKHMDEILGEWDESELLTNVPERDTP